MAINMCEMWFNGIKIAFFFQKITKNRLTAEGFAPRPPKLPAAGGPAPRPPVCDMLEIHWLSRLQSYVFALLNYISLSPLPLQNPG